MQKLDESRICSLIEQIKENNTAAFKEFFCCMQPGIYYFLYRYTSDADAAADLTQETFINFWNHRSCLKNNLSPKSYLYRIARNLAYNYISRKPPVSSFGENENVLVKLGNNPEQDYDRILLLDDFQKAINLLPERCRATFILSRYEGLEYSQIAEVLNVSLQTVKNQMNKAFSVLRKQLADHLD
ncbi:MAG: RNA polymerase sigma-70 factor [Ignavibacteriales bacterium]|nr:MAG: RNA polymerase sigma-70 factor [Ignavibacteriales bacterium]